MNTKLLAGVVLCMIYTCALSSSDHDHVALPDKVVHQNQVDDDSVITLSSSVIQDNHIKIASASSKVIKKRLSVIGKIVPVLSKQIKIYPRFAGIVKSMRYKLGDSVEKNDVMITIESKHSLQVYSIRSPLSGEVIRQYVNVGNWVNEDKPVYQLADLSSVWVELFVYRKDVNRVKKGEHVYIAHDGNSKNVESGIISYISPIGNEHTQSIIARATLPNSDRKYIPGLYVDASIITNSEEVPISVKRTAIQKIDGKEVLFVEVKANSYEPRVVRIGISDNEYVQIIHGIKVGDKYVSENSFILKSELEKGSAEHSH